MFTGLIDDVGVIERVASAPAGRELRIACRYADLDEGESVAVNGVCLTVRERESGWFTVGAVVTTRDRTTVGEWSVGRRVNLERALRAGDRFGGHIVQGHVDGVGTVCSVCTVADARLVEVELPDSADLVVAHGSITIDGVSLTVNDLPAPGVVQLSLIDYTLTHTALAELVRGSRVHVETDMIGKYVQRLITPYQAAVEGGTAGGTR